MKVAIIKNEKMDYNRDAPFNPSNNYPEYPFNEISQRNAAYDAVRNIFFMLGMDKEHYNKDSWNPLGELIEPMNHILLKPNLVRHYNPIGSGMDQLLTHGSIIRACLDYVYIAMKGKGNITIGDAPVQSCNFNKAIKIVGIDQIIDFYNENSDIKINVVDFRKGEENRKIGEFGSEIRNGDPFGYTNVDLKDASELFDIISDCNKFRVTNYDKDEMIKHHNINKNEYLIPNSVLKADVILNLPKLKTHRKAGMTCALKNMIGINGSKDWLPHHRVGSLEEGGNEYLHKSIRKKLLTRLNEKIDMTTNRYYSSLLIILKFSINSTHLITPYKDQYFEGSWYGNDTIPRTITDINKIINYANRNGLLEDNIQRTIFTIVDSIIAGENEGPLEPNPKNCGLIIAGYNPVDVDLVCSQIMGFDYNKIPTFKYAMNAIKYKIFNGFDNIEIYADNCKNFKDIYGKFNCNFIPSNGWKDHIEQNNIPIDG